MDKQEIKTFRKSLKFTQAQFAHILGVAIFTVSRWESGRTAPSRMAQKLLAEVKAGIEKQRRQDKDGK